jgi:hypothetical protein
MGNDGGSIPDRRDLVRNKPKAEQVDKANQTRARWFFCALSKVSTYDLVVLYSISDKLHSFPCKNLSCLVLLENSITKMPSSSIYSIRLPMEMRRRYVATFVH